MGHYRDIRAPPSGTCGFPGTALWEANSSCLCVCVHRSVFLLMAIKGQRSQTSFNIFSTLSKRRLSCLVCKDARLYSQSEKVIALLSGWTCLQFWFCWPINHNFLAYRWEFVGWSLNRLLLFKQLGFVWHSVALIFSVISCSLYSCIYVITILNSFQTSLALLSPFLPFLSLFFLYLTLCFSSCISFFFFAPPELPSPSTSTPILTVSFYLLCQFLRKAPWPFPSPCYITAPLWPAVYCVASPPPNSQADDRPPPRAQCLYQVNNVGIDCLAWWKRIKQIFKVFSGVLFDSFLIEPSLADTYSSVWPCKGGQEFRSLIKTNNHTSH